MKINCTTCGKLIKEEPDPVEHPATAEDLKNVQQLLSQTVNDPNFTIVTSFIFPLYEGMCVDCYDYVFHQWNLPEIKEIIQ